GRTSSNSLHRGLEPVVLPSELTSLPPLHGYLKLSGNYPVAKIQLAPGNYPIRFAAFKER
ncbi:MAG: type IV secretion system DNA-binding domain-containing protein, partial [Burkholderiales bacterium]